MLTANFFGTNLALEKDTQLIATASEKVFSFRDRHEIDILSSEEQAELFAVIAMVTLQMDKKTSNNRSSDDDDDK